MLCVDFPSCWPGPERLVLRALDGHDELDVGPGVLGASRLLERLASTALDGLSLAARDVAMAALYRHLFGDEVACTVPCAACDKRYEASFALSAFVAGRASTPSRKLEGPSADGDYLAGSQRVRLPSIADERAVAGRPAAQAADLLRRRCGLEGAAAELEAELMALAPNLSAAIDVTCPECGQAGSMQFDVTSFGMARLHGERRLLLREIHVLASSYRFGLQEILGLTRDVRRELVAVALSERAPGWSG